MALTAEEKAAKAEEDRLEKLRKQLEADAEANKGNLPENEAEMEARIAKAAEEAAKKAAELVAKQNEKTIADLQAQVQEQQALLAEARLLDNPNPAPRRRTVTHKTRAYDGKGNLVR